MKKTIIVLLHVGYWVLYLLLLIVILFCLSVGAVMKHGVPTEIIGVFVASLIPALMSFYVFYTILFDKFLSPKRIFFLFITGILSALVSGLIGAVVIETFATFKIGLPIFNDGYNSAISIVFLLTIIALLNGGMGLVIRGFIAWYDGIKTKEELTKKNFEMELALVKAQLDPHLLFNTLNNIDALMEKDIQKASLYLNKLSEIMRFTLYETKIDKIPLQKELAYIEKYIELQKIRTSNPDFVHLNIVGETGNCTIAPMVFIPFIENAFKHAAPLKTGNVIDIKIRTEANTIFFMCKNIARSPFLDKNKEGGIGNELIKKRLALLYPNNHSLNIDKNENMYEVNLKIERHEN